MHTALSFIIRSGLFATGLIFTPVPASAFYDPFENVTAIAPSDELETRMWDESRLLKSQLIRPEHQPGLKAVTALVQAVFDRNFPALSNSIRVYVYKESELAVVGTPHGEIFLSSGLMLRMASEEDLVVLLAREMAHIYQRDSARTLSYARTGSNLKEVFSTSFAAYNVTSGLINLNSLAGSLTTLSPDLLLQQLQLTPEKLLESGGSMFAKLLKERLQEDLEGLGRNLGGVLVHRLSVQAVAALVKTSLYGYSDRIENQADLFALTYLQQRYGHVHHYDTLFERLLSQSKADGDIPFLSFYSNPKRLQSRLDSSRDWKESASPVTVAAQLFQKNQQETTASTGLTSPLWQPLASPEVELPPPDGVEVMPVSMNADQPATVTSEMAPSAAPPNESLVDEAPAEAEVTLTEVVVQATSEMPTEVVVEKPLEVSRLLTGELRQFFLDTIEQESRQGAPRRFLANLDRLHTGGLIDPKETRSFETRALRATRLPTDTEKALGLLQADLQQKPDDWPTHQLIADVYVELKTYEQAISHYSRALELSSGDERSLFILDRKTKAENLLAREMKRK